MQVNRKELSNLKQPYFGCFFVPNPLPQNNPPKQATVNTLHYFVVANICYFCDDKL